MLLQKYPALLWVQTEYPFSCCILLSSALSCPLVYPLPVCSIANAPSLLSLSHSFVCPPLLCLSVSAGMEEGEDYPSSGFPLDREWAAFELSLTEASPRSQAVHDARVAQTYGVSRREADVRDGEKRKE